MPDEITLQGIYIANASVLLTHEIDSAYWHEWDLFGIPGGIQVFLLLNLVLVAAVLYGLCALDRGRASGLAICWLVAGGGFFAVAAHGYFLLAGSPAFRLPVSLALLGATLILSTLQVAALLRLDRS